MLFSGCKSTIFSWNIPIILSFFDYRKQIIMPFGVYYRLMLHDGKYMLHD